MKHDKKKQWLSIGLLTLGAAALAIFAAATLDAGDVRASLAALMPGWTALAHAPDGHVEAMQHMHLPWLGMMWHPERPQGDVDAMWCWIENNIPTCEE